MGGTYKAIGINLKGMPMGESDRLLTVLTREHGLIRLVAPGARKHESSLRGRSGLFVVNQLLIAKGRSLDKIIQAESLESFTGLSQDLRKLTAGQYLAELALCQALSNQPQDELFTQLSDALRRLEQLPPGVTLPCLVQAIYHLLELAGVAPQVHACCLTQKPISPEEHDQWRAGFHAGAGGVVAWEAFSQLDRRDGMSGNPNRDPVASTANVTENRNSLKPIAKSTYSKPIKKSKNVGDVAPSEAMAAPSGAATVAEAGGRYAIAARRVNNVRLGSPISAVELEVLQNLNDVNLICADGSLADIFRAPLSPSDPAWVRVERLLRHYAQYHFDHQIQSAALVESCFAASPSLSCSPKHDATD